MRLTAKAEQWRAIARKRMTPAAWREILAAAERIAAGRGSRQVGAVHLFMALEDLAGERHAERPEFPIYHDAQGQEHGEF